MARARVLIAALTGASLLGGAPAGAATGVSIDVARIAVSAELAPGGVYLLPAFGIRNPGTKRTTYHLGVTYIESQSRKQPPVAWFRFEPSTVTLDGGEARAIGAGAGDYAALVGAEIAAERGGTRVGARAAARLTFVVQRSSALDAWWRRLLRFTSENAPWTWLLPGLLLASLLTWQLRRRYSFSVARRT